MRLGLTQGHWKIVGLFAVMGVLGSLSSGSGGGIAWLVGMIIGAVLMVWIPVLLIRLARAGWGRASGVVRS